MATSVQHLFVIHIEFLVTFIQSFIVDSTLDNLRFFVNFWTRCLHVSETAENM